MKYSKIFILALLVLSLTSFNTFHKYYFSVTDIEYAKEKQSVQIIVRMFIDDFEKTLKERYDNTLIIDDKNNKKVDTFIQKYLNQKLTIKIDNKTTSSLYLGKKFEDDLIFCFLEIENIPSINKIEISNKILFDVFENQQNMVKLNINNTNKNLLLIKENDSEVINY